MFPVQCIAKSCFDDDTPPSDGCLLLWRSVATTFQVTEAISRFKERPLLKEPSVRVRQTLSNIVRCSYLNMDFESVSNLRWSFV